MPFSEEPGAVSMLSQQVADQLLSHLGTRQLGIPRTAVTATGPTGQYGSAADPADGL
ncbi:MAG: hypothetical protein KatS3mg111_1321 [Pirellulaceae bacterium]|nr:MAG: hypothetical protein KatS3mg111_1321 [Pirellulaceae bacterium]